MTELEKILLSLNEGIGVEEFTHEQVLEMFQDFIECTIDASSYTDDGDERKLNPGNIKKLILCIEALEVAKSIKAN